MGNQNNQDYNLCCKITWTCHGQFVILLCMFVLLNLSLMNSADGADWQTSMNCIVDKDGQEICQEGMAEAKEEHLKYSGHFKSVDPSFDEWERIHGQGASFKERISYKTMTENNLQDDYLEEYKSGAKARFLPGFVKGSCPKDGSIKICKIRSGSTGVPQENNSPEREIVIATNDIILKSEEYLKYKVLVDDSYHDMIYGCINRHTLCSFWAAIGECFKNESYMKTDCALACKMCEP